MRGINNTADDLFLVGRGVTTSANRKSFKKPETSFGSVNVWSVSY